MVHISHCFSRRKKKPCGILDTDPQITEKNQCWIRKMIPREYPNILKIIWICTINRIISHRSGWMKNRYCQGAVLSFIMNFILWYLIGGWVHLKPHWPLNDSQSPETYWEIKSKSSTMEDIKCHIVYLFRVRIFN